MDSHLLDLVKPLMIGVILVGLFVVVPVVAILTEHQRKMAKILRPRNDDALREEVRSLRMELRAAIGSTATLPPIVPESDDDEDETETSSRFGLRIESSSPRHQN